MNINKLKKLMKEKELDAVVSMSLENVFYTTGAFIMTQKLIPDRLAMCIFPYDGEPTFIVCEIEEALVKSQTNIQDIRTYVEFKDNPIKFLIEVIKEKKLHNGKIGIETDFLVQKYSKKLYESLPRSNIVDCNEVFDKLRMIKTKEEINILEKAATETRKAIDAAFILSHCGDTEFEVVKKILGFMLDNGADDICFSVLGSGYRSIFAHPVPNQTILKEGDIVRVDLGGIFKGYCSDVARNVSVGKPSNKVLKKYNILAHIQKDIIESCKIGVKFCDLYNKCKDFFYQENLPFNMPHIGHGLGVGLHENPIINPFNERKLELNMVVNIEPLLVDNENQACYHLEDLVLCQEDGPRILTGDSLPHKLPIII